MRIKKTGDHCLLTGKSKKAAHVICQLNYRQLFSNFLAVAFHNISKNEANPFFTETVKNKNKQFFRFFHKTDEKYLPISYGSKRVIDSYYFAKKTLDALLKTLEDEDCELTKKILDDPSYLTTKIVYLNGAIKEISDYDKSLTDIKKMETIQF